MKLLVDYKGDFISFSKGSELHIAECHPEITLAYIRIALKDPDEIRISSYRNSSILYYRKKSSKRFICVVVKVCEDGNFISSAMTTSKAKSGEVIYVRK